MPEPDDRQGPVVAVRPRCEARIPDLAINEFDADIYATPAISEGGMYIRTQNALYSIAFR
jgi:hypothetical protein